MTTVYLHSPNLSKFGKFNQSILELSLNTAKVSFENFQNLYPDAKIEFVVFSSFCPEIYANEFHIPSKLSTGLGIENAFCFRIETASSSGSSGFHVAVRLIQSGKFQTGLVVAAEVMSGLSREESNLLLASVLSERQRRLGMSMAQAGALVAQRYLYEFGYTRRDLYSLSKKLHDNGLQNPIAHIQKELSEKEYFSAPIFSSPLGLYDISPLSDGAASLVVSSLTGKVVVRGLGSGTAHLDASIQDLSFPASLSAYEKAYAESGLQPRDIQVAELHDAFTIFEIIGAEDAGLFPKGEALRAVCNQETHPDSRLPINPSGGLKSRGHPIGASGLAQVCELFRFWKHRPECRIGLCHSIGGLATNNFVSILEYLGE